MKSESGSSIWGPKFDQQLDRALQKRSGQAIESEKPGFDWNAPLKSLEELGTRIGGRIITDNFMRMSEDFFENPPHLGIKDTKKLRNIRDISTLALAAVADVLPGMGVALAATNAGIFLGTQAAGFIDKAVKVKKIKTGKISEGSARESTLKKLGLTEDDITASESIGKLTWKSFINDSIIGKLSGENKTIGLETGEKWVAAGAGIAAALGTLITSEVTRETVGLPILKTIVSRLVSRLMIQKLEPWFFVQLSSLAVRGLQSYEGVKQGDLEAKRQDFVDVALTAMSTTMILATTGMMAYKGIAAATAKSQESQPEPTLTEEAAPVVAAAATGTPTLVPTFEHTPTPLLASTQLPGNYSGDEPWKDMAKHHFDPPVAPPSETPPPAEMPVWQPGETVDSNLLQKAVDSGVKYDEITVDIDNDPELETVYRFNLDNDVQPEVWAVKDSNGVWQPWIWEDKGGLYKGDLNLDGKTDQGSLSLNDLKENNLLYSWQGGGGERGPLNLETKDYDLDNDGNNDLLNDENGWYLDRNKDFTFKEGDDVRLISEEPVFYQGQVAKLEAVDGQKWWRGTDGKMIGLVFQHDHWWLDHGGYELDEANPLAPTAFTSGGIEVITPNINNFNLESINEGSEAFHLVLKDAVVQFHGDKGQWQYDASGDLVSGDSDNKGCILADGRTLAFDRVGEKGIMAWQYQLALTHPDWTPDEVAKAAFLHQSEPINLNLSRPEPYRAPSGTLTFDQLAMGPRGGDEGVIMHDVHEVNGNLNATQVAQAAHIAVVNNNLSGSEMISDVNTSIARFSLENVFGQIMAEHQINSNYIPGYAQQAALTVIRDNSIGWSIPSDKISGGQLNQELLQNFSSHNYGWWEEWLKSHGYIN